MEPQRLTGPDGVVGSGRVLGKSRYIIGLRLKGSSEADDVCFGGV